MGGDLDAWIASIRKCELLPEHDLKHLCEYVQELMLEESTVHPVQSPVTICGDIHGQFHDLLELFRNGGECPQTSYIFMVRLPACRRASTLPDFYLSAALAAAACRAAPLLPPVSLTRPSVICARAARVTLSTAATTRSRR